MILLILGTAWITTMIAAPHWERGTSPRRAYLVSRWLGRLEYVRIGLVLLSFVLFFVFIAKHLPTVEPVEKQVASECAGEHVCYHYVSGIRYQVWELYPDGRWRYSETIVISDGIARGK